MEITANGAVIYLDETSEVEDMLNLLCECGHTLSQHAHTWGFGTLKTWYTSQCVPCGFSEDGTKFICKQFRVKNED